MSAFSSTQVFAEMMPEGNFGAARLILFPTTWTCWPAVLHKHRHLFMQITKSISITDCQLTTITKWCFAVIVFTFSASYKVQITHILLLTQTCFLLARCIYCISLNNFQMDCIQYKTWQTLLNTLAAFVLLRCTCYYWMLLLFNL